MEDVPPSSTPSHLLCNSGIHMLHNMSSTHPNPLGLSITTVQVKRELCEMDLRSAPGPNDVRACWTTVRCVSGELCWKDLQLYVKHCVWTWHIQRPESVHLHAQLRQALIIPWIGQHFIGRLSLSCYICQIVSGSTTTGVIHPLSTSCYWTLA